MSRYGVRCILTPKRSLTLGHCNWCSKPLRRTKSGKVHKTLRWCSKECRASWEQNHIWRFARKAAARRDGYRCVKCQRSPYDIPEPLYPDYGSLKQWMDAVAVWRKAVKPLRLEVHHIRPVKGKRQTVTCLHHLSNLRTLCFECHRQEHTA